MSEDPLIAFRRFEAQARQSQLYKAQRLADEQERKKREAENLQLLREQSRVEAEQRQAKERSVSEQQANEKRRANEAGREILLAQLTVNLQSNDQRRNETIQEMQKRLEEVQATKAQGSPIEAAFYDAWCNLCPEIEIQRQYKIGNRRVDFAHPETMTAIELDGHDFHSKRQDRTRDYQRQREIEDQGWFFVRFTGSEVHIDVEGCVRVAWNRIQGRMTR